MGRRTASSALAVVVIVAVVLGVSPVSIARGCFRGPITLWMGSGSGQCASSTHQVGSACLSIITRRYLRPLLTTATHIVLLPPSNDNCLGLYIYVYTYIYMYVHICYSDR